MAAVELKNTALFNDANLVSYYQLENANDNKGANNLTNNGSVAFNAAKFNNGADFGNPNTTPTYLSLASNLGIDGGNITLTAWFKLATESQTAYLVSQQSATSKVAYFLEYLVNSGGGTQSVVFKRLQNGVVEVVGTFVCGSLGTVAFNHIVGTYDGTNVKLYFNGVLKDTQAASGSGSTALSSDFEIGDRAASNPGFAGIIDDVAVFSRALLAQEISDLFSGADAFFNLNDKSPNGNNLINHGATEYTLDFPFAASTEAIALVRASHQYLSAADSVSLDITGDMTLEAWIKPDSVPASGNVTYTIISKYNDDLSTHEAYVFGLFDNVSLGLGIQLFIVQNGSNNKAFFKAQSFSTGVWTHVAAVFTAASKQVEFFVNGASIGTDTDTVVNSIQNVSTEVEIGAFRSGGVEWWDGKIDEVRIWNVARTSLQISNNYNKELFGTETGLAAYWPFEASIATTTSTTTSTSTTTTSTSTSTSTTTTSTSTTHTTTSTSTSTSTTTTSTSTTITVTTTSTTTTSTSTTTTSTSTSTTTTSTSTSSSSSTSTTTTWLYAGEIPSTSTIPTGNIQEDTESMELNFTIERKTEQV